MSHKCCKHTVLYGTSVHGGGEGGTPWSVHKTSKMGLAGLEVSLLLHAIKNACSLVT